MYLTKYFIAGQQFGSDLALLQKFSDLDEITKTVQNALKLLDLIEKYEQQIIL